MDANTLSFYEDMIDMFATDGWQRLMADLIVEADDTDSLVQVNNLEQLYFRKGQLHILNDMLTLEDRMRAALEELENPSDPTEGIDAAYL